MKEQASLVSVVMATFNEPVEYITASIQSILEQTYSNLEFIIVDDSTNIDTIDTINSFAGDNRIKIIRKSYRMGFVGALNEGLKIAKGEYIARMDGDDISQKNRLYIQLKFLESHKNIDILGGAMNIIDKDGNMVSKRCYPTNNIRLLIWTIYRNPISHPTVMFRRKIIDSEFFYDESFCKAEDLEFWLRLRNNGFKIANISQTLLSYRVVGNLAIKRTGKNFKYNYRARIKNLSIKYFFLDILSIRIIKLYCFIPKKFVSVVYASENN
jgi:glycosyltransferase involved in cell wall biosynthesis